MYYVKHQDNIYGPFSLERIEECCENSFFSETDAASTDRNLWYSIKYLLEQHYKQNASKNVKKSSSSPKQNNISCLAVLIVFVVVAIIMSFFESCNKKPFNAKTDIPTTQAELREAHEQDRFRGYRYIEDFQNGMSQLHEIQQKLEEDKRKYNR